MTSKQSPSTSGDTDSPAPTIRTRAYSAFKTTVTNPASQYTLIGLLLVIIASSPATAQQLGDVYCGTDVETVIGTFFSAMLGLGLPISLFYTGYSGFRYMRAGGNPDKEREAKQKLYYGVMGLLIILGVLVLPEIADSIFDTIGYGFSDCVKPFASGTENAANG